MAKKQKVRYGDMFYIPMCEGNDEYVPYEFVVATPLGYIEILAGELKCGEHRKSLASFSDVKYIENIKDIFLEHKHKIRHEQESISNFDTRLP